jgi:hypothetical protein
MKLALFWPIPSMWIANYIITPVQEVVAPHSTRKQEHTQ